MANNIRTPALPYRKHHSPHKEHFRAQLTKIIKAERRLRDVQGRLPDMQWTLL
jgi:hypothetical protein